MNKTYYPIIAILVLGAIMIAALNTRSNKRKRIAIREEISKIQQEIEPKLDQLMELKNNLKEQLHKLKEDTNSLKKEAKKELNSSKQTAQAKGYELKAQTKERIHDLKETTKEKRDLLKKHAGDIKDEAIQEVLDRYDTAITELEALESEMHSWKESFATAIIETKHKASKQAYNKLAAARDKLKDINDRIGKAIEKAGQNMQHHD